MPEKQAFSRLIREKFPFPISHAYGYLESRAAPEDRYQALLACFEVTLKTITSVAVANFMRDIQNDLAMGDVHIFRELLEILSRPISLGHWQKLLQITLRPYANRRELHAMPELFDFYFRVTDNGKVKTQGPRVQWIQHFIQERNEEAHHRNRSQTSARQRKAELPPLEKDLNALLESLSFLADYPWIYVENAQRHDGEWHYRANYARGSRHPFPQQTWKTTLDVNTSRCLLLNETESSVLELYPFTLITAEGRLQQPDVFFFDGLFRSGRSGRANFMNYHIGDYIDPTDSISPAAVASDAIISLLRFLENRLPQVEEESEPLSEPHFSTNDVYRDAVVWALDHGAGQSVTLEALRNILGLPHEEALKQERESQAAHGRLIELVEVEVPFEGDPSWANLAYYILDNSGQAEMYYKDIATEAEALKDQIDMQWSKGDSADVAVIISKVLSKDPRFYKIKRGYYRLTKDNELLSNPSWANLACFVLQRDDSARKGLHLSKISASAGKIKEKYSDWRSPGSKTPRNTVSASMSTDRRFESLSKRGHWRLRETTATSNPAPDIASVTRSQTYEQILARLAKLGEITQLPFGRTYYALAGSIHLMFRYSKTHQRNNENEYFLGVTPQYYERIDDLGNGHLVFVLGDANNVLLVPTETFAEWIADMEISGSGTWPIAFYQSEDGSSVERWVPGAGREDVKPFLNDYNHLRRVLAQKSSADAADLNAPVRVSDLLKAGLIKSGDMLYIPKVPGARATIVDSKWVTYQGEKWSYNDWGTYVTGWKAINIYQQVSLARTGQTLDALRRQLRRG